jgi:hypothetical protein
MMWLNPKSDRRFVDHVASDRFALVLGFIGRLASRMLAAGGGAAIRAAGTEDGREVRDRWVKVKVQGARGTTSARRRAPRSRVPGPTAVGPQWPGQTVTNADGRSS